MTQRRIPMAFAACLVVIAVLATAAPAAASGPLNTTRFGNLALKGYDPVAYFSDGRAAEGDKEFSFEWQGATWRFASQDHRDRFAADPDHYAPQYGGYCAWAVSQGSLADIDPEAWKIVDGKLYLNYSKKVLEKWQADIPGFIAKADANWPGLATR